MTDQSQTLHNILVYTTDLQQISGHITEAVGLHSIIIVDLIVQTTNSQDLYAEVQPKKNRAPAKRAVNQGRTKATKAVDSSAVYAAIDHRRPSNTASSHRT